MPFAADTAALYRALFEASAEELRKEAGLLSRASNRIGGWIARKADPSMAKSLDDAVRQADDAEQALNQIGHTVDEANAVAAQNARRAEIAEQELATLGHNPGAVTQAEQQAVNATKGRNVALGLGAAGVGIGVPGAYMLGRSQGTADRTKTRNLAFGAGAAAGLAAPQVIRGLGNIARGRGAFPMGMGMGTGMGGQRGY